MPDPRPDRLGLRLGAAWRRVDRLANHALAPLGVPHAHAAVLVAVLADPGLHAATIAERTGFEPSTVSRLVAELCRRRLLRRRPDPDDARAQRIFPAKRGEDLGPKLEQVFRRVEARLRRELPESDLKALRRALDVLRGRSD